MFSDFQKLGRDLFLSGLNNSHSGNLSVRKDDKIIITRRGSMLGRLKEDDLVETRLDYEDDNASRASTELIVHRAIYLGTSAKAVVHAHPVHAIALSLMEELILPIDAEGLHHLKKTPVLVVEQSIGSPEVEDKLPGLLKTNKIVVIRGHGSFATGQTLEEAYMWTSSLENACRIIWLTRTLKAWPFP